MRPDRASRRSSPLPGLKTSAGSVWARWERQPRRPPGPARSSKWLLRVTMSPSRCMRGELGGQGASVHPEVVRELLAGERDDEGARPALDRLLGEIGEDALPDGARGDVHHAPRERDVLLGGDAQEVADDAVVSGAGALASGEQGGGPQQEDRRVLGGHDVHQGLAARDRRVRLGEDLPGAEMREDGPLPPVVVRLDVHAALEHDPQARDHVPRAIDALPSPQPQLARVQTGEHPLYVPGVHALEERGV